MTNYVVNFLNKNLIKNNSNKRTKHLNYYFAKLPSSSNHSNISANLTAFISLALYSCSTDFVFSNLG